MNAVPERASFRGADEELRALSEALRRVTAGQSVADGAGPAGGSRALDYGALAQFLGQAAISFTASGLRYWGRMLELWGAAIPSLARALADSARGASAAGGERALVDELRAQLRQLAELPSQELRRLQVDLDILAATLDRRARAEGRDNPEEYWRRWEAKP